MPDVGHRGQEVHSWTQVPRFSSEAEEAEWWQTHSLGQELLDEMGPVPLSEDEASQPRPRTRPVGVRFDEWTLQRLKRLAVRRHKGYQSLLKEFIIERLYEEEKRDGLIGNSHSGSIVS